MKLKNRTTLYAVIRTPQANTSAPNSLVMECYRTFEEADNACGRLNQEYYDKYGNNWYSFEVQAATYYDL